MINFLRYGSMALLIAGIFLQFLYPVGQIFIIVAAIMMLLSFFVFKRKALK